MPVLGVYLIRNVWSKYLFGVQRKLPVSAFLVCGPRRAKYNITLSVSGTYCQD